MLDLECTSCFFVHFCDFKAVLGALLEGLRVCRVLQLIVSLADEFGCHSYFQAVWTKVFSDALILWFLAGCDVHPKP